MDREELLTLAKQNGDRGCEYERQEQLRGEVVASCIGMLIGIAMILARLWVKRQFDFGLCGSLFAYSAIGNIIEGVKGKQKWRIVIGVFCSIVALFNILSFIFLVVLA